jgi:hypothetical protein
MPRENPPVRDVTQPVLFEQQVGPCSGIRDPMEPTREDQVLARRELWVEQGRVAHESDPAARRGTAPRQRILAEDRQRT